MARPGARPGHKGLIEDRGRGGRTASKEFLFIGWLQAGTPADMLTLARAARRTFDGATK
jgi:hypothetical protein